MVFTRRRKQSNPLSPSQASPSDTGSMRKFKQSLFILPTVTTENQHPQSILPSTNSPSNTSTSCSNQTNTPHPISSKHGHSSSTRQNATSPCGSTLIDLETPAQNIPSISPPPQNPPPRTIRDIPSSHPSSAAATASLQARTSNLTRHFFLLCRLRFGSSPNSPSTGAGAPSRKSTSPHLISL